MIGLTWTGRPDEPVEPDEHHIDLTGRVGEGPGDNLLVTGEATDVLAALSATHAGTVQLCYLDPPFNTGGVFGRYRDDQPREAWLTMMYTVLNRVRDLLTEDGTVWIHLDDAAVHLARCLADEVFGPENFVAEVCWQKAYTTRNSARGLSVDCDHILVYGCTRRPRIGRLDRDPARDAEYTSPDGDPRRWVTGDPAAPDPLTPEGVQTTSVYGIANPVTGRMVYPAPGRRWARSRSNMVSLLSDTADYVDAAPDLAVRSAATGIAVSALRADVPDLVPAAAVAVGPDGLYGGGPLPRLYFTDGGLGGLKIKRYLDEVSGGRVAGTLWTHREVGHNRTAKNEIRALFPDRAPFDTPKPERLLERIITLTTSPGDLVLDVFGGSGTTAAVAHKMGRAWITCEADPDNVGDFLLPRLTRVVDGTDLGGITTTRGPRTAVGTPLGGLDPDSAHELSRLLRRALADDPELRSDPAMVALRRSLHTRPGTVTTDWLGGGAFSTAELRPGPAG